MITSKNNIDSAFAFVIFFETSCKLAVSFVFGF